MQIIFALATLTLLSNIALLFSALYLLFKHIGQITFLDPFFRFCKKNALILAFIAALTATSGSLFFSEIMKFVPCKLCWFQRIFIYPQVILLGVALYFRDYNIRRYIIPMCVLGGSFSVYNYYTQLFPPETLACSLNTSESCSNILSMYYGYITFSVMALTASTLIFALMFFHKHSSKPF